MKVNQKQSMKLARKVFKKLAAEKRKEHKKQRTKQKLKSNFRSIADWTTQLRNNESINQHALTAPCGSQSQKKRNEIETKKKSLNESSCCKICSLFGLESLVGL